MEHPLQIPGFDDGSLQVSTGTWKTDLLYRGQPVKFVKNQAELTNQAGETVTLTRKPGMTDVLPSFVLNGEVYRVRPPLPWYQVALAMLPLILIFVGGAIGGGLGGGAYALNLGILRKEEWPSALRVTAVVLMLPVAFTAYLVLGSLILALF